MIKPSTGVASSPIRSAFFGITHVKKKNAYEALTGWIPKEKYASQQETYESEIGAYKGMRILITQNAALWAGAGAAGIDVYSTLIFGQNAYGVIPVDGRSLQTIIHPVGSSGSADAFNQRGTIAKKLTQAATILNESFMYRYEHA